MLGLTPWASLLIVVLMAVLVRQVPPTVHMRGRVVAFARAFVHGPWLPLLIGVATSLATWWVWGSLSRSAVVHDESAYLLQAKLFAQGRFTAPSPPLPRFFEQLYVNLVPAIFSKYPPGTSLLIALGVKFDFPGLPIVVANGFSGMLVFVLARRFGGSLVALLTWTLWITSFPVLYFHAMYLSEVPTSLAWLLTWWGIARWRSSARTLDLGIAAAAIAYCAITRPLTAVALAAAVGMVVVRVTSRRTTSPARLRRAEFVTLGAGAALALVFVALWSWRSTGSPTLTPLTLYTRTYVPFDRLGFGARAEDAPKASLPWDQRVTDRAFYEEHQKHTVARLPVTAVLRARMIGRDMWYDWRGGLALVAIAGLVGAPVELWVGLGALALQVLLYLLYAHPPTWSLYYIEGLPVLAFATALGVPVLLTLGARHRVPSVARLIACSALLLLAIYPAWVTFHQVRAQIEADHSYYDAFVGSLPRRGDSAIVFVRYSQEHNDGLSLVRNVPNLAAERVWVVYDRGADNTQLMSVAPRRSAYVFDEARWSLRRLRRDTVLVQNTR